MLKDFTEKKRNEEKREMEGRGGGGLCRVMDWNVCYLFSIGRVSDGLSSTGFAFW